MSLSDGDDENNNKIEAVVYRSQSGQFSEEEEAGAFIWREFLAGRIQIDQITRSGSFVFSDFGGPNDREDVAAQFGKQLRNKLSQMAAGALTEDELCSLLKQPVGYLILVDKLPAADYCSFEAATAALSITARRELVETSVEDFANTAVRVEGRRKFRGLGLTVSVELHRKTRLEALLLVTDVLRMRDVASWTLCVGRGEVHGSLVLEPLLRAALKLKGYAVEYECPVLRVKPPEAASVQM